MRRFLVPGLLALACLALPRPAHAQLGGINLGAAVGTAKPAGDVDNAFKSGFHIEGLAALSLPLVPIGFRGELAYDEMGAKAAGASALKVASGVVDATFSVPFPVFHPYAIGGIGFYEHNSAVDNGREGKVGFNGGVGVELKLPVIRVFGEARYHTISFSNTRVGIIPITVGLVF